MRGTLVVLAMAVSAPTAAVAQEEVMAPIHQFTDGFNKGDVKSAVAACADQTQIIDEFPPHEWHGPGACATWAGEYDEWAKREGITDGIVKLGAPRHSEVTGDVAYVVIPANYKFKKKGKAKAEVGSVLTVVLKKGAAGWRITAWSWAKH